jgi:rhamnulokinase
VGRYLAFDLGAESGRAMVGHLRSGVLSLTEIQRFANQPIRQRASLRWDLARLWDEMRRALAQAASDGSALASIGVDSWGCDYGLLDADGALVSSPYHYRDERTDGIMEAVFARVPRSRIYDITGIQFLPFNTIYQLVAARDRTPGELTATKSFGTIPDILNHRLTGVLRAEFTNATTTQMVDARRRTWAVDLLRELDLPVHVLPPIVEPGTVIGPLAASVCPALAGTPVVAPACHDTGSAVAAVAASGARAFLSSGTWSLLGVEVPQPVITSQALAANFTNEGGVAGTTRLLKNIGGLWPLQECRRAFAAKGREYTYPELMVAASDDTYAFRSLFDPDDPRLLHPADMPRAIADYCRATGQRQPETPGSFARAILESLAFKYRVVLDTLEDLTGGRITEVQIVGGGSQNRLLNQFTADATGRTVVAGPVEATALGNIAVQMVAMEAVASIGDARGIIERSFPTDRVETRGAELWDAHYARFKQYVEQVSRPRTGH